MKSSEDMILAVMNAIKKALYYCRGDFLASCVVICLIESQLSKLSQLHKWIFAGS